MTLVSVIIPTFNRAAFLAQALASIYSQNYTDMQVIVVDDGSTDDTATVVQDVARRFGADPAYIYQANQGPVVARNRGIDRAQGEWIAFLDSDDLWAAGRLVRQLALAAAHPTAQMVWGMVQVLRGEAAAQPFTPVGAPLLQTQWGSALLRHTLFAPSRVGRLDEALYTNDDVDWFLRLLEQKVDVVIHQDVVAYYRWHGSNLVANVPGQNLSAQQAPAKHGLLHAIARSLQRRRRTGGDQSAGALQANLLMVGNATAADESISQTKPAAIAIRA